MGIFHTFLLEDPQATKALGERLSARLKAGDVVFLIGDLGMGKTTLARSIIASKCGVDDAPSPTYTIIQTYETSDNIPLWHVDLYRVEEKAELEQLGLEDAFDDAISLIEWPERLGDDAPANRLEVQLSVPQGGMDTAREVRITGLGEWESRIDDI